MCAHTFFIHACIHVYVTGHIFMILISLKLIYVTESVLQGNLRTAQRNLKYITEISEL